MARKQSKSSKAADIASMVSLPDQTKRAITVVFLFIVGIFLILAAFDGAGVIGADTYRFFVYLLGIGYFLLPLLFFVLAGTALTQKENSFTVLKGIASILFFVAGLGFVAIVSNNGGFVGSLIAQPLVKYLDVYAALIVLGGLSLISLLIILEGNISLEPFTALGHLIKRLVMGGEETAEKELTLTGANLDAPEEDGRDEQEDEGREEVPMPIPKMPAQPHPQPASSKEATAAALQTLLGEYQAPPLNLLERDRGRPGVGDIKGNANIIKRTLQNFGITVELDEISIGPSVTRYAIKPAEGVRLQKIVSLQTNLELALAAHPVRIEAPIPGKSLVGIEVPNSSKVTVGLGTILESPEFAEARKPLLGGTWSRHCRSITLWQHR
jgi:S-DNA-T family DNA segregation ATPase FtsK/SpoIIIE